MKIVLFSIIGIVIIIAICYFIKQNKKKKLVDEILIKNPNGDASREKLMELDIKTLEGILAGTIR